MNTSGASNSSYMPNRIIKITSSKHASVRFQQRGIQTDLMPLVTGFGDAEFDGNGSIRYLMSRKALMKLRRIGVLPTTLEKLKDVYAVVSIDNRTVITIGHLYK